MALTRAAFESRSADWLSLGDALERILESAAPLGTEEVALADARGRAIADPLVASCTLPAHDNSAMDGYAVRGEDVRGADPERPRELTVTGVARAGGEAAPPVGPGEAVRIMTGAPLPPGADSVVRVEHTDREAGAVGTLRIRSDADADRNVRPAGEDLREGDLLLEAGTALTPGCLALLAALGVPRIRVRRRPRVALLSTGDELVPPEAVERIREGRAVADSNGVFLAAAVEEAGALAIRLGIVGDDADLLRAAVSRAGDADVLVTTGGASMGEADLLKRVLEEDGLETLFWRVRMRPGTPFGLYRLPREGRPPLPVLGLPGNPASAFVTFEVFVRPYLLARAGHARPHRPVLRARAGERLASTPKAAHFLRVTLEAPIGGSEPPVARLAGPQGSGLVRSLATADGLAFVPDGADVVEAGDEVCVVLLDRGPGGAAAPGYLELVRGEEEG